MDVVVWCRFGLRDLRLGRICCSVHWSYSEKKEPLPVQFNYQFCSPPQGVAAQVGRGGGECGLHVLGQKPEDSFS